MKVYLGTFQCNNNFKLKYYYYFMHTYLYLIFRTYSWKKVAWKKKLGTWVKWLTTLDNVIRLMSTLWLDWMTSIKKQLEKNLQLIHLEICDFECVTVAVTYYSKWTFSQILMNFFSYSLTYISISSLIICKLMNTYSQTCSQICFQIHMK